MKNEIDVLKTEVMKQVTLVKVIAMVLMFSWIGLCRIRPDRQMNPGLNRLGPKASGSVSRPKKFIRSKPGFKVGPIRTG